MYGNYFAFIEVKEWKKKMSRIGNKPITVPSEVQIKIDGQNITVTGPKGTLEREIHKNISVAIEGNTINVTRPNDLKKMKSLLVISII